ncbi:hypothetical protein V3Q90_15415 [Flavobacterium oreochromis]|uniref:hypothetical protein n=1 Tax=Flavobacterium oreochromis TaxID=2906078 RepID=UPI003859E27B
MIYTNKMSRPKKVYIFIFNSEDGIKMFIKDVTSNPEILKLIKTDADDVIDSWLLLTEKKLPICTK